MQLPCWITEEISFFLCFNLCFFPFSSYSCWFFHLLDMPLWLTPSVFSWQEKQDSSLATQKYSRLWKGNCTNQRRFVEVPSMPSPTTMIEQLIPTSLVNWFGIICHMSRCQPESRQRNVGDWSHGKQADREGGEKNGVERKYIICLQGTNM